MDIGIKPGTPENEVLLNNLGKVAYTLDKAYISNLSRDYMPIPYSTGDAAFSATNPVDYLSNIRALRVERWVFDKNEKPGDCFKNVLSLFADGDHTLAMVVIRNIDSSEVYFVVKNDGEARNGDSASNIALLNDALLGNFPGTKTTIIDEVSIPDDGDSQDHVRKFIRYTENLFSFDWTKSIAVLSNTPSEFSADYITQGIEKLLNGIVPKSDDDKYAVVFLAESVSQETIREIVDGYEDIATAIHPFSSYQFQTGTNETVTKGEMQSATDTKGISKAVTKTHSFNVGVNASKHKGVSAVLNLGPLNIGANSGKSIGISGGYGYSWGTTKTISNSTSKTNGTTSSLSLGKSESTNYSFKSYMVSDLIDRLTKTIERINASKATGLWKFATYVMAKDAITSKNVANYVRAISQGKDSYLEPPFVQEWSKKETADENGGDEFDNVLQYMTHFTHPVFVTSDAEGNNAMAVSPTSYVSTDEVSHVIAFPRHSVSGLPVIECARFGREPHALTEIKCDVEMGKAYHMFNIEEKRPIAISKENLTSHTFITGSTGSGKSNTIYHLLGQLCPEKGPQTHFLVIEPAKGEYKKVFGKRADVKVYSTNPKLSELLRINPFSFPDEIHIYEHMDRLIEIFNVCWPMYAAMPAVLKDAVEQAYKNAGWDLQTSTNKYSTKLFPSFVDVLSEIENVMNASQYSADSKGDYKGALCTRLKSLTNGINSLIFCSDELTGSDLFDQNVIIDLSRVGSSETKSLIMGLLVLKLQEYRMAHGDMNEDLKHITVLEEAHNILKRTSAEQSSESSNLVGKSVEMLANAIAEMRTYGEGFVIADQAPGLLDESIIRNTNTKIVLRLPDYSDRILVGKAIGLSDIQIDELARLEKGVAAIYQNDWMETVLCKIAKYSFDKNERNVFSGVTLTPNTVRDNLISRFLKKDLFHLIDSVDDSVWKADLPVKAKCLLYDYFYATEKQKYELAAGVAYEMFGGSAIISQITPQMDFSEKKRCLSLCLNQELAPLPIAEQSFILNLIVIWHAHITESAEIRTLAEHLIEQSRLEGIR